MKQDRIYISDTPMRCPSCGSDVAALLRDLGARGGRARAAGMTEAQRKRASRKATRALLARSEEAKAETRRKQSEAAKAAWAKRKDPFRGNVTFAVTFVDGKTGQRAPVGG